MTLDQALKYLQSMPDTDPTLAAVLALIRARRAESILRFKTPPSKLTAGDREFESGAFTALDELGVELQTLTRQRNPPAG